MKTEDIEVVGKQRAKPSKIKAWYIRPTCKNCSELQTLKQQSVFDSPCEISIC